MNPFPNATISGTAIVLAPGHFNPDRAKTGKQQDRMPVTSLTVKNVIFLFSGP